MLISSEMLTKRLEHEAFDLRCGDAGHAASLIRPLLQQSVGNIVAVPRAALVRMCWGHAVAAVVEDAALSNVVTSYTRCSTSSAIAIPCLVLLVSAHACAALAMLAASSSRCRSS